MDFAGKRDLFLAKRADITKATKARERIDAILDEGSFMETGAFVAQRPTELGGSVEAAAEGVVTGWGTIDGNPVCIFSQDVLALGGALSEMHAKKICALYDYALKTGVPVIGIFDSKGARIAEGVDALNGYSEIISKSAMAANTVPQIAVVSGNCGGALAVIASCFDFIVAVNGCEYYFNSPTVIAATENKAEEKAGAAEAAASGMASFVCENDAEAAAVVKSLVGYIPANSSGAKNYDSTSDDINRLANLEALEGGRAVDVLAECADNGVWFEVGAKNAEEVFTGFARFDGEAVAVVGYSGAITASGAAKAAEFIGFADMFGMSVVSIVDSEGFERSSAFEKGGIAAVAGLSTAYATSTVPTITLVTGKATGSVYALVGSKGLGADMVLAWPQAEISALSAGAAVDVLMADKLKDAEDAISERARLEEEYAEKLAAPYEAARHGYIDEIIDPAETRQALVYALGLFSSMD